MVETTRAHERIERRSPDGARVSIEELFDQPARVFVPATSRTGADVAFFIHFHGADYLAELAAQRAGLAVVTLNLGAGSGVYTRAFRDVAQFERLLDRATESIGTLSGKPVRRDVILTAYSAGYGAIREILRGARGSDRVRAVLLLDGLHAGYLPERQPLAEGGVLDTLGLVPFARFGESAVQGGARMMITHSEIFPGTFASTTETSDWLLQRLGLRRTPVLEWGPLGMQQISRAAAGQLEILGFAGNSAPNHVDHLHALPDFLERLLARSR